MKPKQVLLPRSLLLSFLLLLSCCAELPQGERAGAGDAGDPLEPMNRRVYDNNYFLDRLLVRPLAELYRATVPPGLRDRLSGILSNMKEPVVFANDVLQGDFDKAGITAERFGINTTIGVGGMWDFANEWDLPQQTGDFGQTLASWGVDEGPYLFLPFFGPSNFRDALGFGIDFAMSPWQYVAYFQGGPESLIQYEAAYIGTDSLLRREKYIETVDALRAGSLDPYAKVRSAYRQHRRAQLGVAQKEDLSKIGN